MITWLELAGHPGLEMVYCKVTVEPDINPVRDELAALGSVMFPEPLTIVQRPSPFDGTFPSRTKTL